MKYWFRPRRFWGVFAFYRPVSSEGWLATILLLVIAAALFVSADSHSHSGSDTLINFAPWAIAILCVFDLLCFRFGEYPDWWRKQEKKQRR